MSEASQSSDPRVYRGVVFGGGAVARQSHLPAYERDPVLKSRVQIVAIVDPEAALSTDGMPVVRDREALRRMGPIDFIDICTPTTSHLELALWGLDQGYHVLCEKPVALDTMEAALLSRHALAAGRIVMPCHQYRYNPAWQQVSRWLADDAIGHWHLGEFDVYRPGADRGAASDSLPWRVDVARSRGGILLDHGTHLLYSLLDIAGPPSSIRGWAGRLQHASYTVEDSVVVLFEYPARLVTMTLTWAARRRENRVRFFGDRGTVDWAGARVELDSDAGNQSLLIVEAVDKSSYWRWFSQLFCAFVAAMDDVDPHSQTNSLESARLLADIAGVAALLERSYAACGGASRALSAADQA